MILRLTSKLSKKLKCSPEEILPKALNPMEDWVAHIFTSGRKQFVFFTNTYSLLSVVAPKKGINSTRTLLSTVRQSLESYFAYLDVSNPEQYIFPNIDFGPTISKVGDRSVQGSINEMIYHASGHIHDGLEDLDEVARRINEIPMFSLPGFYPWKVHLSNEHTLSE